MNYQTTSVIKNVDFIFVPELDERFIYGTVIKDVLGRWQPNDWMVSSPIRHIDVDKLIVRTLNSSYHIDRITVDIPMTFEQLLMVRNGIPPTVILKEMK